MQSAHITPLFSEHVSERSPLLRVTRYILDVFSILDVVGSTISKVMMGCSFADTYVA